MSAYLYDEWGNLLSGKVHTNGFYSDLYLYNGEATDITTGLQYLRARYYDPGTGRICAGKYCSPHIAVSQTTPPFDSIEICL